MREGGASDRWFAVLLLMLAGVVVGLAAASDRDRDVRFALAAIGVALLFGASSQRAGFRRERAAAQAAARVDERLEQQIELLASIDSRLASIEAQSKAVEGD